VVENDSEKAAVDESHAKRQSALQHFEAWLDSDEAQRASLIARVAAEDPATHTRLLKLIAADQAADEAHFLDGGAIADAGIVDDELTLSDLSGRQFGAWRLERLLGIGGAGQVWLGRRCDGQHGGAAAIKLLRIAELDGYAQQRFAREGRLLAELEHPHVARLIDVGKNAEGQRYLVLEYIDGERIDRWCDRHAIDISARLQLFLQVCEAVAYAHAHLIVHRDLKPSNILVQENGDVKLLDFGVAKLLSGDVAEGELTELTHAAGAAFTPEYASPEQFEGKSVTVTTDVYSLGVVLYLLLAGRRPYADELSTPAQFARAIVDGEPRRLSATGGTADDTQRIAARRGTTADQLRRQLRGDLDTILGAALKKNPTERYASVQAFADDVQRYLDHRPIRARGDSRRYRLRKFLRRHRAGVGATLLILVAVIAAMISVIRAERVATREAERAQAVQQFLVGLFQEADPGQAQGEKRSVQELLARGEKDLRDKLADQPRTKLTLLGVLGSIYDQLGDSRKSLEIDQSARDLAEHEFGTTSLEYADAVTALADAQRNANDMAAAEKSYLQAREIFRHYPGERAKQLAITQAELAFVYEQTNRDEQALRLLTDAMPQIAASYGAHSWELAEQKSLLASLYAKMHDNDAAVRLYAELAPLLEKAPPDHALDAAVILGNEGYALMAMGRTAECERVIHKAVGEYDRLAGPDNNYAVSALRTLGYAQTDAGEYAKASATFADMVGRSARAFGADTAEFALNESFRTGPMIYTGHPADAEAAMSAVIDNAEHKPGLTPAEIRGVQRRYALALIWNGHPQKAIDVLQAIAATEREGKDPAAKLAATLLYLAGAQTAAGKPALAVETARESAELYASVDKAVEEGIAQLTQAIAQSAAGGASGAEATIDQADANLHRRLQGDAIRLQFVAVVRAQVLRAEGRAGEAAALDDAARAALRERAGVNLPETLAMLY
jgi:eukaryotic-like serine/threonine-protein kinase